VRVEFQEPDEQKVKPDPKKKHKSVKLSKNLIKHGLGKFIKCSSSPEENDGFEYIGTFKDDQRHGMRGTCFYSNGDFYSGPWRYDKYDSSILKVMSK